MWRVTLLAMIVFLCAVACSPTNSRTGKAAPDFEVEAISPPGNVVRLSSHKGKVVLLDFWATWCGPCREIAPKIDAMYKKYNAQGFEVMSISDESRAIVEKFTKSEKRAYPVYIDLQNNANLAYPGNYIPRLYVIDKAGNIAYEETMTSADPVAEAEDAVKRCLAQA